MLQITSANFKPSVFIQVEAKVRKVLEALSTYVTTVDGQIRWSVKVTKGVRRPRRLNPDAPLSLLPLGTGLPSFLCFVDANGAAFECSIDGIDREFLGLAIDALNQARGRFKKTPKQDLEIKGFVSDVTVITQEINTDKNEIREVYSKEHIAILAQLGSGLANEIPKLEDFMLELWSTFADRAKDDRFFVFNHELTPLIKKHFKVEGVGIANVYAVRLYLLGKRVDAGSPQANGWEFVLSTIEAFCEHKIGLPKRVVGGRTVNMPALPTADICSAKYPELREPGQQETEADGILNIVMTGGELAARLESSTGLDADLIAQAGRLIAEHETHKVNAIAIEADIQKIESARDTLEVKRADLMSQIDGLNVEIDDVKSQIENACVRLNTAKHRIERTRLPQETIDKLELMRKQIDQLFAAIGKQ